MESVFIVAYPDVPPPQKLTSGLRIMPSDSALRQNQPDTISLHASKVGSPGRGFQRRNGVPVVRPRFRAVGRLTVTSFFDDRHPLPRTGPGGGAGVKRAKLTSFTPHEDTIEDACQRPGPGEAELFQREATAKQFAEWTASKWPNGRVICSRGPRSARIAAQPCIAPIFWAEPCSRECRRNKSQSAQIADTLSMIRDIGWF